MRLDQIRLNYIVMIYYVISYDIRSEQNDVYYVILYYIRIDQIKLDYIRFYYFIIIYNTKLY